jgi:hypothetical protein
MQQMLRCVCAGQQAAGGAANWRTSQCDGVSMGRGFLVNAANAEDVAVCAGHQAAGGAAGWRTDADDVSVFVQQ